MKSTRTEVWNRNQKASNLFQPQCENWSHSRTILQKKVVKIQVRSCNTLGWLTYLFLPEYSNVYLALLINMDFHYKSKTSTYGNLLFQPILFSHFSQDSYVSLKRYKERKIILLFHSTATILVILTSPVDSSLQINLFAHNCTRITIDDC